jgi:predicted phage tail protein
MKDQRMTTIKLSGEMGRRFGKVHHVFLDTNSPSEAVRYLRS